MLKGRVGSGVCVVRDFRSDRVSQYLLVERVEVNVGVLASLSTPETHTAQDALKRAPHVLITVRVDDGVYQGIDLSQDQEELLHSEHLAVTVHTVKQQQHQTRSPTHHKTP